MKLVRLALVLFTVGASGCGERSKQGTASRSMPGSYPGANIVLITVDTLRADHLQPYGYPKVDTPWATRLASDGVLFETAIVQAPLTLPSHCSIMTGAYPTSTKVRDQSGFVLAEEQTTLAETLKKVGYETAAFVASSVLGAETGMKQGFDVYSEPMITEGKKAAATEDLERRGDEVLGEALKWIESPGRNKFFAWIHLFDPHTPYKPPEPFASRYSQDPYDGEIAYVDSLLGILLQSAISRGWYDSSIIWFTSDHGESLGEHGEESHGFFVYDATLRVPSIVKLPSSHRKQIRVSSQVRGIDIVPTLLELVGIERAEQMQGESLVSRMTANTNLPSLVSYSETYFPYYHFEWSPLVCLRSGQYKYIEAPRPELYNTEMDPGEKDNISAKNPDLCRKLSEQILSEYLKGKTAATPSSEAANTETHKRLSSLGYVGMSRPTKRQPGHDLPDPKDKIFLYQSLQDAIAAAHEGRIDESIRELRKVLKQDDRIIDAHLNLGVNYAEKGRFEEAVKSFESVIKLDQNNLLASFNLGLCYAQLRKWKAAIRSFQRTLELNPNETEALVALGRAYQLQGDLSRATEAFEKAIAQKPNLAQAHGYLAEVDKARRTGGRAAADTRDLSRQGVTRGATTSH